MALDLSTLKNKAPESAAPSLNQVSDEEKERLRKMAEENPPENVETVKTAFLVLVHDDGAVEVRPDLTAKVSREEIPNTALIYQAVSTVAKDIKVQETAQYTAMFMQQAAMQMQQHIQAQQVAQGLNLKH